MNGGSIWMVLLLAAGVMGGCGNGGYPTEAGGRDALRVMPDTARNRLWVLGLDGAQVYDTRKNRLIRKVELPGWSVVRYVCPPDMALDRSGSVYISSNVQSKLWRVDADSFKVEERQITLHDREQWDVGFGALAFAADGTLLALTSLGGSLWRIDAGKGSARMVEQNTAYLNVCDLTPQFLNDFERKKP